MIDFGKISNVEVEDIDMGDYPEFCDAYIESCDIDGVAATEEQLDEISNGRTGWQAVVGNMWSSLSEQVAKAEIALMGTSKVKVPGFEWNTKRRRARRRSTPHPIGEDCPQCGQPLVQRKSKHGPFIGCSGYPKCRYTRRIE